MPAKSLRWPENSAIRLRP